MSWVGVLWILLLIALIALAVTAALWLVRSQSTHRSGASTAARDQLDRRYAAGDLSRDEYLERRRDLER
ncbi:MAG: SHOCT domain-containing protein [Actinomycetota bacterium]|nr:SHOCT domain-containing protein [Actinomycetota bacterium]